MEFYMEMCNSCKRRLGIVGWPNFYIQETCKELAWEAREKMEEASF